MNFYCLDTACFARIVIALQQLKALALILMEACAWLSNTVHAGLVGSSIAVENVEALFIRILGLTHPVRAFKIVCAYRCPSSSVSFWDDLESAVGSIDYNKLNLFGDFKMQLRSMKLANRRVTPSTLWSSFNFVSVVNSPTWTTNESQTSVDVALTHTSHHLESRVVDYVLPDHNLTITWFNCCWRNVT